MKSFLTAMLCACLMITQGFAETTDEKNNNNYEYYGPLGQGAFDSSTEALGISMMAWGIGLAGAIAIVAGVLHQSREESSHSHSD